MNPGQNCQRTSDNTLNKREAKPAAGAAAFAEEGDAAGVPEEGDAPEGCLPAEARRGS